MSEQKPQGPITGTSLLAKLSEETACVSREKLSALFAERDELKAENEKLKEHIKDWNGVYTCPACGESCSTEPGHWLSYSAIEFENEKLRAELMAAQSLLDWVRDGIEHFTHDEDAAQVEHLVTRIDNFLKGGGHESK